MKTRHLRFTTLLLLLFLSLPHISAQRRGNVAKAYERERKEEIKFLKNAYRYRSDIPKWVLKMTKKWPDKVGILHGNWIENRGGKSVTIYGGELFPNYDYVGLQQFCDSLWVMKGRNGKLAVVTGSGRPITDFSYGDIRFWYADDGILECKENKYSDAGITDLYTIEGNLVLSKENTKINSIRPFPAEGLYLIDYTDDAGTHSEWIYANGQRLIDNVEKWIPNDCYLDEKSLSEDTLIVKRKGDRAVVHRIVKKKPTEDCSFTDYHALTAQESEADMQSYVSNKWIMLYNRYEQKKDYKSALFCMAFWRKYELQTLRRRTSLPDMHSFYTVINCLMNMHDYQDVLDLLSSPFNKRRNIQGFPWDYSFSATDNCFFVHTDGLNAEQAQQKTAWAQDVSNTYHAANRLRQEQIQRQNAIAGAIAGALLGVTSSIVSNTGRSPAKTTPARSGVAPTAGKNSAAVSSSSASSSSSSPKEQHIKCTVCNGTGVCTSCKGSGKGTKLGMDTTCGRCGGHPKCSSCDGKGYKVRY